MSIDLQLNTAVIKLEESNLQYLPAKLEATAEEAANVAVYFDAYTSEESNDGILCLICCANLLHYGVPLLQAHAGTRCVVIRCVDDRSQYPIRISV